MSDHVNFTSLPPEQEAQFAIYERVQEERLKTGLTAAIVASAIFAVFALGIYFGVTPEEDKIGQDMDINQLKKKSKDQPAPTPEAPSK